MKTSATKKTTTVLTFAFATALLASGCSGNTGDSPEPTTATSSQAAAPSTSASPTEDASQSSASPTGSATQSPESQSPGSQKSDLSQTSFDTSWQDAVDSAKKKFSGEVSKIELEANDAGRYAYKVEVINDTQKYETHIDANSGEVINEETDDLDDDERGTEKDKKRLDLDKVVSLDDAMKTAQQEQAGAVNKWKLEGTSAGPRYEFDITPDGANEDREIKVDAISGKLVPGDD